MPIVYNATADEQSFQAHGKWFTFKPEQKKIMSEEMALFISMERKANGMVVLPSEYEEPDYQTTPEGQARLAKLRQEGVDNYINFHRDIIRNNQVSLRRDLERHGEKVDPAIEISEGELKSMEIVAKYQKIKGDSEQIKVDHVRELMKQVGPVNK